MQGYLVTLIGMSILISVVGMVVPQKVKKYVRLVCAVCLLCVILKPIPELLGSKGSELFAGLDIFHGAEDVQEDKAFYNEIYNNTIRKASEEKIAAGLETMMIKDLGLPEDSFEVRVEIDDGENYVKVRKVSVLISMDAVSRDPHAVVSYLEEMLECTCEIIYV